MTYAAISPLAKTELFSEQWQPKVVAEMNDYQFKVARLEGDFVWHSHADTDETFMVPKGKEHKPFAAKEVKVMLIEPRGVVNTGDEDQGERTAQNDVWI